MNDKFLLKAFLIAGIIITTSISAFTQKNCKAKLVRFPQNSNSATVSGKTNQCAEYLLLVGKNQRLRVNLTATNPEVYFWMDIVDDAEDEGGDGFCEDCKTFDYYFDEPMSWKISVYNGEAVERRAIDYTLTLTLTDSPIVEDGILNGKAVSLPKPPFPPEAKGKMASGTVKLEVRVGEDGRVYNVQSVAGDEIFYIAAEQAALNAKFEPRIVNDKIVRVKGFIIYRFKPN